MINVPAERSAEPVVTTAMAEVNRQLQAYRALRADQPALFGNHADGYYDGTPEHGPMPLPVMYPLEGGEWRYRVLWGVHTHRWALNWAYCFGAASDSRGERTDPALLLDIRHLPKIYIGRYRINRHLGCDRRSHCVIIGRALAAGFDLASISEAR